MGEPSIISVTEVRNAFRCPRLFALGRLGTPAAFPVGSSCMGGAFHRVVERFARQADQAPPWARQEKASNLDISALLRRWVLDLLVEELETDPAYASLSAEVDDLAEACRQFADHLASRLSQGQAKSLEDLSKLIVSGEKSVDAFCPEAGLTLRGRLDALFCAPDGGLEVVEYKLTDEANHALDQAQVALYRELLKRTEGMDAKALILRFNPMLTVTELDPTTSDNLVRSELLPLLQKMAFWIEHPDQAPPPASHCLCAACPSQAACAAQYPQSLSFRDEPPAGAARPRPSLDGTLHAGSSRLAPSTGLEDEEGKREALAIRQKIMEELRKEGVSAEAADPIVGPSLYLVPVCRLRGALHQLDRVADTIRNRLDFRDHIEVTFHKQGARRQFVVQREEPRTVHLTDLLAAKAGWLSEKPGRFIVGLEPDGKILTGDLSDSATSHLLIGGQTGSGKSWLLKSLIASLVHFHDPSSIKLTLIDPKRVTFQSVPFMAAVSAHCDRSVLFDLEEALPCFEQFVQVMEERYELFAKLKAEDLDDYNQMVPPQQRLARHVIVMDEFQDLTADKQSAQAFTLAVDRLGSKARAAGIHLILATQRPDRERVPARIKSNLSGKIALKVANQVNSRVILDQGGAEALLGRGDMLADLGKGLIRAQAAVAG